MYACLCYGAWGRQYARGTEVGAAAAAAAKAWALGIPAGLVLRSVGKGQLPPQPFVIVTMVGQVSHSSFGVSVEA